MGWFIPVGWWKSLKSWPQALVKMPGPKEPGAILEVMFVSSESSNSPRSHRNAKPSMVCIKFGLITLKLDGFEVTQQGMKCSN